MASFANKRGIAHKGSGGRNFVFPDVCFTPIPGGGQAPIPYPNVGKSADVVGGPTSVTIEGNMPATQGAKFCKSSGDEPGSRGGVVSGVNRGECEFLIYSFDIRVEGRGLGRLGDVLFHNKKNTVG